MTNQAEPPRPETPEPEAEPPAATVADREVPSTEPSRDGPGVASVPEASPSAALGDDPPGDGPVDGVVAETEAGDTTPADDPAGDAPDGDPAGAPADEAGQGEAADPAEADPPPQEAIAAEADPDAAMPDPDQLAAAVRLAEALVFASDRPVTPHMLAALLPEGLTAATVMAALAEACEGRGVTLTEVAGGWAFRTAPDLAQRLTKVVQAPRRLPRAAMEALSIVAYHQPCTRGEIEEIRGASLAQTTLEALLELGLIAPRGRREVPGRPTLWGTTPKFLEQFGLKALSDLPRKEELVTAETGPALPLPGIAPPSDPEA